MTKPEFGTCCQDLKDAMTSPPTSFILVDEKDILYLTVGYIQTEQGPGWFDQAVIYCPFCGKLLQDRDKIAMKTQS